MKRAIQTPGAAVTCTRIGRLMRCTVLAALALHAGCSPDASTPGGGVVEPLPSTALAQLYSVSPDRGRPIPDQYIVVLKEGFDPATVASDHGARPKYLYRSALLGFTAELKQGQIKKLQRDGRVKYIEQDQEITVEDAGVQDVEPSLGSGAFAATADVSPLSVQTPPGNWGLDRIDQPTSALDNLYRYTTRGTNVHVYILGGGINRTHTEFGTRVPAVGGTNGYDAFGGTGAPCSGASTADAGIIGGVTYGVAKNVRMHNVKVFDCLSTTASIIIAGTDWVSHNHIRPAIAQLGITVLSSTALSDAIANSVLYGVTWVATGGNSFTNACTLAYGSTVGVIVTSSTNLTDTNNGPDDSCVDIFAPGDTIRTAWIGSNTATGTRNGGWAAASFAVGLAALFLEANPHAGPGMVWDVLRSMSQKGVVANAGAAPNRLARKWSFELSAGGSRFEPDGGTFTTTTSGYIRGWLVGTPGTNYNLKLDKQDPVTLAWSTVASRATASTKEKITYNGTAGTYRWQVISASGSGSYDLFALFPN